MIEYSFDCPQLPTRGEKKKPFRDTSIGVNRGGRRREIALGAQYAPPEKHFDDCGPRWGMGAEM